MAHHWDRGVLNAASWHGLEEVGTMADATDMILAGECSGAWPTSIGSEGVLSASGIVARGYKAIVGQYMSFPDRVLGVVGGRFRATACQEWRDLVNAAVTAGAKPTGAFSLREGSRVLATFEVGQSNGMRTQLLLCDAFDGSIKLTAGFTSIRVVCANTMSAAMRKDGEGMAALRHTTSLEERVKHLSAGIGEAIESGDKVRATYERAKSVYLNREQARVVFDSLFPEAEEKDSDRQKTRAENKRDEARKAAAMAINKEGDRPGNLATLWNAATYLVDRNLDGSARKTRGDSDALDSLLFGSRAERVEEIETKICLLMKDGSESIVGAREAIEVGIDPKIVGAKVLAEILGETN